MLLKFFVENFMSYDQENGLDMVAASKETSHPNHVLHAGNNKLLSCAAVYGANGAGKSNLIKALAFAKHRILAIRERDEIVPVQTFKLSTNSAKKPAGFDFLIHTQGKTYQYGLSVTSEMVVEEWLYLVTKTRETPLFKRSVENGEPRVEIFAALARKSSNDYKRIALLVQGLNNNQSFLSFAYQNKIESIKPVIDWFRKTLVIVSNDIDYTQALGYAYRNPDSINVFSQILRDADIGVSDLVLTEKPVNESALPSYVTQERLNFMRSFMKLMPNGHSISEPDLGDNHLLKKNKILTFNMNENDEMALVDFVFNHISENGDAVPFDINEESDGTRKLLAYLPMLADDQDEEKVYVVDELERSMHPMLARVFLKLVLSNAAQSRKQLVFASHETHLMDLELLRRDEIWFVEKDKHGASHLYSLIEFKPRPDKVIAKGYLQGRYGAIPFLGRLDQLFSTQDDQQLNSKPEKHNGKKAKAAG